MALTRYGKMIVWSIIGFVIFLNLAFLLKLGGNVYVMFGGIIVFVAVFVYGFKNWQEKESGMYPLASDDLQKRAAAVKSTQLFHSYATPKLWGIIGIVLALIYYVSEFAGPRSNGPSWTPFTILSLVAVYGFIGYRMYRMRQVWPTIKRFAEHSGWTLDAGVDGRQLTPLHFAPPPPTRRHPVTSELHVMRRDGSPLLLVVEEFVQKGNGFFQTTVSVLCWVAVRLPGQVPGWVRLLPEEKMFLKILRDQDSEYHAFNQKYYAHADPAKLRTQVLSPDLIDWYFHLPIRPWLHVEGEMACLSVGWKPTYVQLQQLIEAAAQLPKFIKLSGALEPVNQAEPLFPQGDS